MRLTDLEGECEDPIFQLIVPFDLQRPNSLSSGLPGPHPNGQDSSILDHAHIVFMPRPIGGAIKRDDAV